MRERNFENAIKLIERIDVIFLEDISEYSSLNDIAAYYAIILILGSVGANNYIWNVPLSAREILKANGLA